MDDARCSREEDFDGASAVLCSWRETHEIQENGSSLAAVRYNARCARACPDSTDDRYSVPNSNFESHNGRSRCTTSFSHRLAAYDVLNHVS